MGPTQRDADRHNTLTALRASPARGTTKGILRDIMSGLAQSPSKTLSHHQRALVMKVLERYRLPMLSATESHTYHELPKLPPHRKLAALLRALDKMPPPDF